MDMAMDASYDSTTKEMMPSEVLDVFWMQNIPAWEERMERGGRVDGCCGID